MSRGPFEPVGGAGVPASRYLDRGFFELERGRLWPRVWQLAGRADDIPGPGDYFEYRIAGLSFLVVRQADGTIKAFENACPHRATALANGRGSLPDRELVCPFHGWRFGIDGTCTFVYGERGFDPRHARPENVRLKECSVAERFGHVWLHFDRDAPPLEDHLGEIDSVLASLELDRTAVNWWRDVRIGANWKIALEAFLEAYHIVQTHPELADGAVGEEYDPDAVCYELDEARGHGWLGPAPGSPLPQKSPAELVVLYNRILHPGVEGWCTRRQMEIMDVLWAQVPEALSDEQFLPEYFAAIREDAARGGTPLPECMGLALAYVFPNVALINNYGNTMLYRFRPDPVDPEACTWEIWSLSIAAESRDERVELEHLPGQSALPPVYAQDASNMEKQQLGLRSPSFSMMRYSERYEPLIPAMHRVLDAYLSG